MSVDLLAAAHAWHNAGCCVIPARPDGSKAPWSRWKDYQHVRSTPEALESWFSGETFDGLGLVCGEVSGNLEMFEIEGRAAASGMGERLAGLMRDNGLSNLWRRVTDGYLEQTPSGGYHWLLRIDGTCRPPTKLASNSSGECLIETKGEGGFTIVAPSGGRTHPTGQPWVVKMGGVGTIPIVTEAERDSLYAIATMLDQTPPVAEAPRMPTRDRQPSELRPGDDYNQRADWTEILQPHGWTYKVTFAGGARGWLRPDKTVGISATTGRNDGDNLYVFSTSTIFEQTTAYTKFAAYTLLNQGGDYSAAARALSALGYGTPLERTLHAVPDFDATVPPAGTPSPAQGDTALPVSPTRPFAGLDLSLLNGPLPPLDFLIDGRMTRKTLTLLGSKPGVGKSWLAQSAALGVASGTSWIGHPCEQGRVLYLDAENGERLALRRLQQLGGDPDAIGDRLHYVTESMVFPNGADQYRLRLTLEEFKPDLVIVDTLASIAPTAESGTEEASSFLAAVWHTVRDSGASMLLLCHLRKAMQGASKDDPLSSFRGAGHLVGAAHRAWVLDPTAPEKFVLRDVKTREFAAVPAVKLALIDTGEGDAVRTTLEVEGSEATVESGYDRFLANVLLALDAAPTGQRRTVELLDLGDGEAEKTLNNYLTRATATGVIHRVRQGWYERAANGSATVEMEGGA